MLNSDVIDILIGVVLVYFLLSLLCSAAMEWIAVKLKLRRRDLYLGIQDLLSGADGPAAIEMQKITEHPLVKGLAQSSEVQLQWPRAMRWLIWVGTLPLCGLYALLGPRIDAPAPALPSYMPSRTFAAVLTDLVLAKSPREATKATAGSTVASLRRAIDDLPDGDVKTNLRVLLRRAGSDVAEFQAELERWFDDAMDRVTGWYKRRAQMILLILAVPLVCALNADTLTMADSLLKNSVLREQLASTATQTVASRSDATPTDAESDDPEALLKELKGLDLLGWKPPSEDGSDPREAPRYDLGIEIKVGGHYLIHDAKGTTDGFDLGGWVWKLFGLGITVVAVSQGSPFWFDLLKKLVNMRSAGKAPDTSAEAAAKK